MLGVELVEEFVAAALVEPRVHLAAVEAERKGRRADREGRGILAACVEAQQGTIDKFMGDSLMAFWGAPENQPYQAERACRAARAMAQGIIADNKHRREQNLEPVRICIGLHMGPAIVGNIGAPGRINYTVVGDAVNMAQRIQAIAKDHLTEREEVVALASETVLRAAGECEAACSVGAYKLRGRREATNIVRLV